MKDILLRLELDVFKRLKAQAKNNQRSVTAEIRFIIIQNLKQ